MSVGSQNGNCSLLQWWEIPAHQIPVTQAERSKGKWCSFIHAGVFAASSVCGDYNSSLKSTVKTYLLHVVAWWAILWGLFTCHLWLGDFEMNNPFISSSLIHFWRQELRGRGAGQSHVQWGAEEGDAWAKCWWGEGSRARNKPLPAGHLAASLGLLMAVPCSPASLSCAWEQSLWKRSRFLWCWDLFSF